MENSRKYADWEIEPTLLTPNKNGSPNNVKIKEITGAVESNTLNSFCKEHEITKNALLLASTILTLNKFTYTSKTLIAISAFDKSNISEIPEGNFPFFINNEKRQQTIHEFLQQVNETLKNASNDSGQSPDNLKPEFIYSYYENCMPTDKNMKTNFKLNLNIINNQDCIELNIKYND